MAARDRINSYRPSFSGAPFSRRFAGLLPWMFVVGVVALCWGRGRAPRALALVCCVGAGELTWLQAVYRQASWALILHGFYVPLFLGGFAYLFLVFPSQRQLRIGRWTLRPEHILVPALPIGVGWNILVFLADDSASLLMVIRWLAGT